MDKRAVFLLVFCFTLLSTLVVSIVSVLSKHSWIDTVLYSLVTMWVVGIISQLMIHHLYMAIIKPMEEKLFEQRIKKKYSHDIDLDKVEKIDDVLLKEASGQKEETSEGKEADLALVEE